MQPTQGLLDLAGQALRVTVLDQDIGRGLGQKPLQLLGITPDRRIQAVGGKDHPRARPLKAQVLGKHDLVVFAVVRRCTAQLDGQNRNPSPGQPTGHAVNDHPVSEVGKAAGGVLTGLLQDNFRQALLAHQLCR